MSESTYSLRPRLQRRAKGLRLLEPSWKGLGLVDEQVAGEDEEDATDADVGSVEFDEAVLQSSQQVPPPVASQMVHIPGCPTALAAAYMALFLDQSIMEELIEDRFGPDILHLFQEKRRLLGEGSEVAKDYAMEAEGALASGGEVGLPNSAPVESLTAVSSLVRAESQQRLSNVEGEEVAGVQQVESSRMGVTENLETIDANTEVALNAEVNVDGVAPSATSLATATAVSTVVFGAAAGVGLLAGASAALGDGQFLAAGSAVAPFTAGSSAAPTMAGAAVLPSVPAATAAAAEMSTEGCEG